MSAGIAEPAATSGTSASVVPLEAISAPPLRQRGVVSLRTFAGVLAVAVAAAAWLLRPGGDQQAPFSAAVAPTDLAAFLAWGVPVHMEENDRVINVTPQVALDPRGGFLVADGREAQVRLYGTDGDLRRVIGRKGNGPGEFRHLSSVRRLPDGRIVATEMGGKVSLFDANGALLRAGQAQVAPLYDADVLDGRHLVLAGRRVGTGGTSLVHVYDVETGAVIRGFFSVPRHPAELAGGYAFAGTADAVVRGDTVAAVFALSDSIYLFDAASGAELGRVAIPFEHFRRLTRPMPASGATIDAFRAWGESFSAIAHLHWLRDGSFLVQYYDMRGVEPRWRLLHMDRAGRRLFEGVDTPRLLTAGGAADELVFVHPAAEAPNVWVSARLRR